MEELSLASSHGSLRVICGPMCSGKTQELLYSLTMLADIGEKVVLISHQFDNRNGADNVSSHSSQYKGLSEKITLVKSDQLMQVDVSSFDTVGVDEAQFFDDLYDTVFQWLTLKKRIYICGLDGDYKQRPFGQIASLLPIADDFIKKRSKCHHCCKVARECKLQVHHDAPFTKRIVSSENETVLVGGLDKYVPVCRFHL